MYIPYFHDLTSSAAWRIRASVFIAAMALLLAVAACTDTEPIEKRLKALETENAGMETRLDAVRESSQSDIQTAAADLSEQIESNKLATEKNVQEIAANAAADLAAAAGLSEQIESNKLATEKEIAANAEADLAAAGLREQIESNKLAAEKNVQEIAANAATALQEAVSDADEQISSLTEAQTSLDSDVETLFASSTQLSESVASLDTSISEKLDSQSGEIQTLRDDVDGIVIPDLSPYALKTDIPGDFANVVESAKDSVVCIDVMFYYTYYGCDTGFYVDSVGTVLTAERVVSISSSSTTLPKGIRVTRSDGESKIEYSIKRRIPNIRAVLISPKTPVESVPFPIAESFAQGQEVLTLGYPSNSVNDKILVASTGIIGASANYHDRTSSIWPYFVIDAMTNNGSEGSPLLNPRGEVVGFFDVSDVSSAPYSYMINITGRDFSGD